MMPALPASCHSYRSIILLFAETRPVRSGLPFRQQFAVLIFQMLESPIVVFGKVPLESLYASAESLGTGLAEHLNVLFEWSLFTVPMGISFSAVASASRQPGHQLGDAVSAVVILFVILQLGAPPSSAVQLVKPVVGGQRFIVSSTTARKT